MIFFDWRRRVGIFRFQKRCLTASARAVLPITEDFKKTHHELHSVMPVSDSTEALRPARAKVFCAIGVSVDDYTVMSGLAVPRRRRIFQTAPPSAPAARSAHGATRRKSSCSEI